MASHKQKKELFVSDLLGGSVSEIYYVTGVALSAYLTLLVLQKYDIAVPFPIDYVLNNVALLLSITLYSSHVKLLHLLIAIPTVLIGIYGAVGSGSSGEANGRKKSADASEEDPSAKPAPPKLLVKKSFLTAYRASMIIITNLSILAVDFNVFPRRFAKVETWGTSLMDLGVGSFVFSMGLVNSRPIIKQIFAQETKQAYKFLVYQYLGLIWRNVVKALPILLLGFVRLVSVKSLEYQEHVTEYGIHWNFFFTLGFLPIVIGILDPLLNIFPRALVALSIGLVYELALNQLDLLKFILRTDNRMESLITQNKEGILSFFGYLSIFIFGQSFGSFVLTDFKTPGNLLWMSTFGEYEKSKIKNKKRNKNKSITSWFTVTTAQGLLVATVVYQLLFLYVKESPYFNNISRRIANLPYVLWVVSYNAFFLFGYKTIELLVFRTELEGRSTTGSVIFEAVNNNGLVCFLFGNLFTGLINMSIDTIECSDAVAFAILFAYGAVLTGIMIILDKRGIYIKI